MGTMAGAVTRNYPADGFVAGFLAMLAFWPAVAPAALAYALGAAAIGLRPAETLLLSAAAFSGPAQFAAVELLAVGASSYAIVLTALLLHAHVVVFGMALGRRAVFSPGARLACAALLTDTTYALSCAAPRLRPAYLLGVGLSMYLAWVGGTALALAGHGWLPAFGPGLHLLAPLAIATMLALTLRARADLLVAAAAGLTMLLVHGAAAVPLAVLAGCVVGVWAQGRRGAATPEGART